MTNGSFDFFSASLAMHIEFEYDGDRTVVLFACAGGVWLFLFRCDFLGIFLEKNETNLSVIHPKIALRK